ncbi:MAG: mannose-1-phosphate guanylyltransferase [Candidatus Kapabacteria bacterium]|nr:mannose-1-phosphate guanylyltransferase [Ignavibacteriota bacterium]MCW5883768.1 mannose-1-phosphate guanylyltransferase [Candidatus Kapabacteria bacterium]
MKKVALIMAGGLGSKFWPKSTENKPKQFTHMIGEGTLLQNTYNRLLSYFGRENIFIVLNYSHRLLAIKQLPGIPEENLIFEPFGRHTAPCTALSINYLLQKGYDEDTLMAVFPSDHIISNLGEFYNSLDTAFEYATDNDSILTIGIEPTRPETQFGYIQIDNPDHPGSNLSYCMTFAEKPDAGTAERFIESGDFMWNSGIFIWKVKVIQNAFEKFLPEYNSKFKSLDKFFGKEEYIEELRYMYKQINSLSLDYGILEKADNVYCIRASFTWSDLGNWDELFRLQMKDAHNNVIMGDIVSIHNKNSFLVSDGKLIGVVGMDDVIVIDSDEALLICKRGQSENVQEIVDFMRRKNIHKYL